MRQRLDAFYHDVCVTSHMQHISPMYSYIHANQPTSGFFSRLITQRRSKLSGHIERAAPSEDHTHGPVTCATSLRIGAVQEADRGSPGLARSSVISRRSIVICIHSALRRATNRSFWRPIWSDLCSLSAPPDDDDDDDYFYYYSANFITYFDA